MDKPKYKNKKDLKFKEQEENPLIDKDQKKEVQKQKSIKLKLETGDLNKNISNNNKSKENNNSHHVHQKGHHGESQAHAHYLGVSHSNKYSMYNNKLKDPLKISDNHVAEDYYSLIWVSLKKEIWDDKFFYDNQIFLTKSNIFQLILEFLIFLFLVLITIGILMKETFTELKFTYANLRIEILRILLVYFAQKLLSPELNKGTHKLKYVTRYKEEFSYPNFAIFVCFCQIFMSIVSYICIVMFMCLSNKALPLVMHFAEVAIIIELDDWIGEMICKEYPDEGQKPLDVIDEDINNKMSLHSKIAMVREDLRIINDLNIPNPNPLLRLAEWLSCYVPWFLLPFVSTILFEFIIKKLQPNLIDISIAN